MNTWHLFFRSEEPLMPTYLIKASIIYLTESDVSYTAVDTDVGLAFEIDGLMATGERGKLQIGGHTIADPNSEIEAQAYKNFLSFENNNDSSTTFSHLVSLGQKLAKDFDVMGTLNLKKKLFSASTGDSHIQTFSAVRPPDLSEWENNER